ncbi:hypothetical protein ISN76_05760 [Dyella halodurans]|uniref:Uncharacterized protein n=1 Tax=Dyella halodurans TaxID=1920171 RepID=A0ABV9C572_9GAMM|nr:hypothetical protein [Dyella halodurans]
MKGTGVAAPTLGTVAASCAGCRHRLDDQRNVEQRMPGLTSFGSAYGASIAASRLCLLHDSWVSPADGCAQFSAKG